MIVSGGVVLCLLFCNTVLSVLSASTLLKGSRPRNYKSFFMLNSTENEISTAHKKLKYRQLKKFLTLSLSDVVGI